MPPDVARARPKPPGSGADRIAAALQENGRHAVPLLYHPGRAGGFLLRRPRLKEQDVPAMPPPMLDTDHMRRALLLAREAAARGEVPVGDGSKSRTI